MTCVGSSLLLRMMMMKTVLFHRRLNFRIAFGLLLALLVVGIPFFLFFYNFHKNQLIESLKTSSTNLSQLVLRSLEQRMLEDEPHLIDPDVRRLSAHSGVERIMILNTQGEVRISSDDSMRGRIFTRNDSSCSVCHSHERGAPRQTTVIEKGPASQIFRSVLLIDNKPKCFKCHATSQQVNGILMVDLSMTEAARQLGSSLQKMLVLATLMVVVTIVALGGLMNRLILRRLKAFTKTTVAIRGGNLDERVDARDEDEISELAGSFNMMTASLKESLREVQRHKDYLENIINSIQDEIVVVDRNLRIVTANTTFLERSAAQKQEIVGQPCYWVSQQTELSCRERPMESCPALGVLRHGEVRKVLHRFPDQEGNEKYIEIHCYPLLDEAGQVFQVIEVRRDISERRYLEAQLSHSERLASLGLLASGISHEINNPLASIAACTEGLKRRLDGEQGSRCPMDVDEVKEYIGLIHQEAMRAKSITDRLLILSRKAESSTCLVSINQSLSETISLLRFQAREKDIQILENLDVTVPPIKANDSALRQVFLNLVLNAMQAIEGAGRITVETKLKGDGVMITVEDTGCGIAKEDLSKLFEPFFSRKTPGEGTGLGLFISNILIRQMGGRIKVQSAPSKGSRFTLFLPLEAPGEV
jgi:PAS domain S-box-containing protein